MISVIVPVFNVERYIKKCLDSLILQTYSDLQIIVVDDGSTDKSRNICEEFARKDRRISVYHKKNGGLSSARNYGMQYASGEYVSFIDSDDWIDEDFYRVLLTKMCDSNADIAIGGITYHYSDRIQKCHGKINYCGNTFDLLEAFFDRKHYLGTAVWNRLYKREIINDLFFPEGKYYEDIVYTVESFTRSKSFVVTDEVSYHYVVSRPESIMNKIVPESHLMDALVLYEQRADFLLQKGLKQYMPRAEMMEIKVILSTISNLYRNKEIKKKRIYLTAIRENSKKIKQRGFIKSICGCLMLKGISICPRLTSWIYYCFLQRKMKEKH